MCCLLSIMGGLNYFWIASSLLGISSHGSGRPFARAIKYSVATNGFPSWPPPIGMLYSTGVWRASKIRSCLFAIVVHTMVHLSSDGAWVRIPVQRRCYTMKVVVDIASRSDWNAQAGEIIHLLREMELSVWSSWCFSPGIMFAMAILRCRSGRCD